MLIISTVMVVSMIGGDDKPDITTDLPDAGQPDSNPDDGGVNDGSIDDGASDEASGEDDQSTDDGDEDESNDDESGDDEDEGDDDQPDDEDQGPPNKHRSQSREGERVGAPKDQAPLEHQQALRALESVDDKSSGENGPDADDVVDDDAEANGGDGEQHQDQESGQQTNGDANQKNGH
ncbi:MAG: hypothetical protein JSV90_03980 [Methanobacteriota archaeon]|nr:MAG: hypothetical protein JSV90_03980 [Euryarchaeota archaeon]